VASTVRIGIVGDFDDTFRPHVATNEAIQNASAASGCVAEPCWIPTDLIDPADPTSQLEYFHALWGAPCPRPYKSLEGALAAIRFARERHWPFVGT
jgi:CTP synthase (UTP-ammonia lyase)